jgi:hypothetical protein
MQHYFLHVEFLSVQDMHGTFVMFCVVNEQTCELKYSAKYFKQETSNVWKRKRFCLVDQSRGEDRSPRGQAPHNMEKRLLQPGPTTT